VIFSTQVVNQYRKHQISMAAERKKKRHEEALAVDVANEDRMKKDEAEFQVRGKGRCRMRGERMRGKKRGRVRNFPFQTLKIRKVSLVVMGSGRYALRLASPRPAYRPPGVWPPAGCN
jgi:hypothetical protein